MAPLPGDADVQLLSVGLRPIRVSQILRTLANTDFRAVRLMDAAPSQVLSQVSRARAGRARDALEHAGATVAIRTLDTATDD